MTKAGLWKLIAVIATAAIGVTVMVFNPAAGIVLTFLGIVWKIGWDLYQENKRDAERLADSEAKRPKVEVAATLSTTSASGFDLVIAVTNVGQVTIESVEADLVGSGHLERDGAKSRSGYILAFRPEGTQTIRPTDKPLTMKLEGKAIKQFAGHGLDVMSCEIVVRTGRVEIMRVPTQRTERYLKAFLPKDPSP